MIDGDTLVLRNSKEERIRLIGINAPEIRMREGMCVDRECGGCVAREQLRSMLEGQTVLIYRHGSDRYGRTLAYVHALTKISQAPSPFRLQNSSVNLYLVLNGYAIAERRFPHAYMKAYLWAESFARANLQGVWSHCYDKMP